MDSSPKRVPCDQCYDRRVRCLGYPGRPCNICTKAHRECTRNLVRRKRGPKKSEAANLPIDDAGSAIPGNQHGSTSVSGYCFQVAPSSPNQSIRERPASEVSDRVAVHTSASLGASFQHGRVQFRNELSRSSNPTIAELAAFVMGDDTNSMNQNQNQNPSDWLLGFRTGSFTGHQGSTAKSPYATKDAVRPNSEYGTPDSIIQDDANRNISEYFCPSSVTPGTPTVLDGTALALATGMPLRYGAEMIDCVEIYFSRLDHVLPILHEGQFRSLLAFPSQLSTAERGLLLAFCAVSKLRSYQMNGEPADRDERDSGRLFLEQFLRLRCDLDYMEQKNPLSVITSFLVHTAFAWLGKNKSSLHYLREAIGQALDLGLHKKETRCNLNKIEEICVRRTLALIFVTERGTGILDNLDVLLLREHPYLPDLYFDQQDHDHLIGFQFLFGLFALLDQEVVDCWLTSSISTIDGSKPEHFRLKLHSVQDKLSYTSFEDKNLNDFQKADILVTQQWLRLVFWQIAMRKGFLSIWSENPAFSYNYPIDIGKDLCKVLRSLPKNALIPHHFTIYSKIFEIAYSLMDTLMLSGNTAEGPGVDELKELFGHLSKSTISSMTYSRILMEKGSGQTQNR